MRILFGDDADLLAHARLEIVARPDLDVVLAGTTAEAVEVAGASPRPRFAILPAQGEIDGLEVCRRLKAGPGEVGVILALSPSEADKRDSCFVAGADDVVFGPVEAADIASRIDARNSLPFRGAPRADVELAVHLQGSMNGPVIECKGKQISREALQLELPQGLEPPPPNTLVRVIFTLYEGGTLTVWGRFAGEPARTVVRFVGLATAETRAIDYFVDFYLKASTARSHVAEITGLEIPPVSTASAASPMPRGSGPAGEIPAAAPAAAPPSPAPGLPPIAEVPLSDLFGTPDGSIPPASIPAAAPPEPAPRTPAASGISDLIPSNETLQHLVNADLDAIASAAARTATTRDSSTVPPQGFSVRRFAGLVTKLSSAEMAALKGVSPYGHTASDLRFSAGAKLRLYEMNAQLRSPNPTFEKTVAEQAVMAAIAESQQIHMRIQAAIESRLKGADMEAVRELGSVNTNTVMVCQDLKRTLDMEVLRQARAPVAPLQSGIQAAPVKFEKHEKPAEAAKKKAGKPGKQAGSGKGKTIALAVFLLVGGGASLYQNRHVLTGGVVKEYHAKKWLFESGPIHVVQQYGDNPVIFIVDATWTHATDAERAAAVAEMKSRAAPAPKMDVLMGTGQQLMSLTLSSPTPPPMPSATPAESPH